MNVHSIKSSTRGRPRIDDKRRLILDAALRVFAERGYHGTAVPEVAQAAKVSTGTLYHYFESKELLVNEVYRDTKTRLRAALLDTLPKLDPYQMDQGRAWFTALWNRLGTFARAEPDAFRFLEMQDHTPYLDNESKQVELSVLAPLWLEGKRLTDRASGASDPSGVSDAPPVDVAIALLWGAFVGLIKASRLGYLTVDDTSLARAGAACWRMIAPQLPRAAAPTQTRTVAARTRAAATGESHTVAAQPPAARSRRSPSGRQTGEAHETAPGQSLTRRAVGHAADQPGAATPTRPRTAPTQIPPTRAPRHGAYGPKLASTLTDNALPTQTPRTVTPTQKVPRSPRTRKG